MDVKPLNPPAPPRGQAAPSLDGRPPVAATAPQPFVYPLQGEFREPDWTRIPGYRTASRADWESALWQRKHTVKNLRELKEALGDLLPDDLAAEHRAGPARAGDDVDPHPAADDQHDGPGGPVARPGPPLHAARLRRPADRLAEPPARQPRQPPRGGHVGRGRADPPLPHQGAGGDALHLSPVLRPLHPHGPGGQRRAAGGEAPVRPPAARAVREDPRLPPPDARRSATWSSRAATSPTCPIQTLEAFVSRCWTSRTSATSGWPRRASWACRSTSSRPRCSRGSTRLAKKALRARNASSRCTPT